MDTHMVPQQIGSFLLSLYQPSLLPTHFQCSPPASYTFRPVPIPFIAAFLYYSQPLHHLTASTHSPSAGVPFQTVLLITLSGNFSLLTCSLIRFLVSVYFFPLLQSSFNPSPLSSGNFLFLLLQTVEVILKA